MICYFKQARKIFGRQYKSLLVRNFFHGDGPEGCVRRIHFSLLARTEWNNDTAETNNNTVKEISFKNFSLFTKGITAKKLQSLLYKRW